MEKPAGKPDYFDKLEANMSLGLSSNFVAMVGVVAAWIFLTKSEWVEGFWAIGFTSFSLIPAFMGDSLNSYVLGRVRLDHQQNWDDVKITPEGMQWTLRWFVPVRALSLLTTLALASLFLSGLAPKPEAWVWLKWLFTGCFVFHYARCYFTIIRHMAPAAPIFSGRALKWRFWFTTLVSVGWLLWLHGRAPGAFTKLDTVFHGFVYFLLCAFLHPLPSKFSLFRAHHERPVVVERVEALVQPPMVPAAIADRFSAEVKNWQEQLKFENHGFIRMPLLELPLFETVGQAFTAPDQRALCLILWSEVRQRGHRSVLSWHNQQVFITTDFGAPDARFPETVQYLNLPHDTSPADFWKAHCDRFSPDATTLRERFFEQLDVLVAQMRHFLQRGMKAPAAEITPQIQNA